MALHVGPHQGAVRIVVPYAVGVGPDVVARSVAQSLEGGLKQSVVVDYKAGAGGTIGAGEVARALIVVRRLDRIEIGVDRDLGINRDLASARKVDDHVRQQAPLAVIVRRLFDEIDIGRHARRLDDIAQLFLAPAAAHFRPGAQRGGKLLRFHPHVIRRLGEIAHAPNQFAARPLLFRAQFFQPFFVTGQRFGHWTDQLVERLALFSRLGGGGDAMRFKGLRGALQKRPVRFIEQFRGRRPEVRVHARPELGKGALAFAKPRFGGGDFRLKPAAVGFDGFQILAQRTDFAGARFRRRKRDARRFKLGAKADAAPLLAKRVKDGEHRQQRDRNQQPESRPFGTEAGPGELFKDHEGCLALRAPIRNRNRGLPARRGKQIPRSSYNWR